jgi:hypothetical protein
VVGTDSILGEWLEAHADAPLVKRAWLLAEGKGSVEDKRDHLQDLIKLAKGIATQLPYDPAKNAYTTRPSTPLNR